MSILVRGKAEGDVNKALAINAYEEQYVKPLELCAESELKQVNWQKLNQQH